MKTVLVATAATIALLGATTARADQPAGFKESPRLEAAASFVAGKPVTTWCATSTASFSAAAQASTGNADAAGFVQAVGASQAFFPPKVCATIVAYLNKRKVEEYNLAAWLLTLAHEATHMRGVSDESETDCAALHVMPTMIRRFFKPRPGYTVHDLMTYAWDVHSREAASYTRLC